MKPINYQWILIKGPMEKDLLASVNSDELYEPQEGIEFRYY